MTLPYFENASSSSSARASGGSWRTSRETPTSFLPLVLVYPRSPPLPPPCRMSPSRRGDRLRLRLRLRLRDLAGRGERRSSSESPPSRGGDWDLDLSSPRGLRSSERAGGSLGAGESSLRPFSASGERALSSSPLMLERGLGDRERLLIASGLCIFAEPSSRACFGLFSAVFSRLFSNSRDRSHTQTCRNVAVL